MAVRSAHGRARELGALRVVETLPVDELPDGAPDPNAVQEPGRDARGRFRAGDPATRKAASHAGQARRHRTQLAHTLGVTTDDPDWAQLLKQAEAFRRAQVRMLREAVGGGECGPAPAALVSLAALALAGAKRAYAQGDAAQGAKLAAEVRQHLLGAHELCAKEGAALEKARAFGGYGDEE